MYVELLPRLGYPNVSAQVVDQTCACVTGVITNALTGDAVFRHRWQAAKYAAALSFDASYGKHTADDILVPADPLAEALSEAKQCAATATATAGSPK
jgi:hypothetical protein